MKKFMKNIKTGAMFPYNEAHVQNLFMEGLKDSSKAADRTPINNLAECDKNGELLIQDESKAPPPEQPSTEPDNTLIEMTKAELIAYADAKEIKIDVTKKKADIIAVIRENE